MFVAAAVAALTRWRRRGRLCRQRDRRRHRRHGRRRHDGLHVGARAKPCLGGPAARPQARANTRCAAQ